MLVFSLLFLLPGSAALAQTSHFFRGSVRQLTRGIPSLVPVPKNMISDLSVGLLKSRSPLDKLFPLLFTPLSGNGALRRASMELEADGGAARILIEPGSRKIELGRGHGFFSADRTISRRHVSFELHENEARVSFEVLGRNPVVVLTKEGIKKLFRKKETGDLFAGDRFSLSIKRPVFFSLNIREAGDERTREKENTQVPSPDFSQIGDPAKEFGLIVRGHEFDGYGRRIRQPEQWNWFLEEHSEDSDREEEAATKKRKKRARKGKRRDDKDEEWTGDSEDEEMAASKARSAGRRPGYLTRSKSPGKVTRRKDESASRKRKFNVEDEEDETLGGFIVGNNGEEEEMQDEEEEEEEEFEDEDEMKSDDTLGGIIVGSNGQKEEVQEKEEEEEEEFEDKDDE